MCYEEQTELVLVVSRPTQQAGKDLTVISRALPATDDLYLVHGSHVWCCSALVQHTDIVSRNLKRIVTTPIALRTERVHWTEEWTNIETIAICGTRCSARDWLWWT